MDVPAKLRAIAAAARGAHALHEGGLLHGGICPQAIAIVATGAGEQLSGLSSGSTATAGTTGAVLAPPPMANGQRLAAQVGYPPLGYIDPQLIRGEAGRWSDIWALGATARQVVTGSVPFPGIEDIAVVQALSQLLLAPAPAPAELPPAISGIIGACLSADPSNRPATAKEVADRLEEAAAQW
jgi:serine/threonine protein kinase